MVNWPLHNRAILPSPPKMKILSLFMIHVTLFMKLEYTIGWYYIFSAVLIYVLNACVDTFIVTDVNVHCDSCLKTGIHSSWCIEFQIRNISSTQRHISWWKQYITAKRVLKWPVIWAVILELTYWGMHKMVAVCMQQFQMHLSDSKCSWSGSNCTEVLPTCPITNNSRLVREGFDAE